MVRFRKAKGIKSVERSYEKILSADYVRDYVEVERFIECCKMCPNYGAKWGCPPYAFNVKEKYELFSDEDGETTSTPTLTHEQYLRLEDFLKA